MIVGIGHVVSGFYFHKMTCVSSKNSPDFSFAQTNVFLQVGTRFSYARHIINPVLDFMIDCNPSEPG